ncbi:MAG: prepilin-type N-terminal cleavage/methylation domain-containing protein [Candidatus Omnitrophica bacterium]|nr:prepilin-type N-terminal cleavage/methylation domain-containing protein [Candidatus Omnitrophota bacterium]
MIIIYCNYTSIKALKAERMLTVKNKAGYTLVELMIAVIIIGVLASIALPNYYKTRIGTRKGICMNNLRQIEAAVDRWVFENDIDEGYSVTQGDEDEIYVYLKNGKPECPARGIYTISTIGTYPQISCSVEGHVLAQ